MLWAEILGRKYGHRRADRGLTMLEAIGLSVRDVVLVVSVIGWFAGFYVLTVYRLKKVETTLAAKVDASVCDIKERHFTQELADIKEVNKSIFKKIDEVNEKLYVLVRNNQ